MEMNFTRESSEIINSTAMAVYRRKASLSTSATLSIILKMGKEKSPLLIKAAMMVNS